MGSRPRDEADKQSVARFLSGDASGFDDLFRGYSPQIYEFLFRLVHSRQTAEELTQEVFVRVYQRLVGFEGRSSLKNWIYRIANNVVVDYWRRYYGTEKRVSPDRTVDINGYENIPSARAESRVEREVLRREVSAAVRDAADRLMPEERLVFSMRHFAEKKYKEIVKITGMSRRKSIYLLKRANEKVAKDLKTKGFHESILDDIE